jgi:serine phosphatase RsbU (regulator of sigma subunit)
VPGVEGIEIGGDWYDVIPVDDDHCFFVVGDVSGRGLGAAATMASLRHAIRAYVAQGDPPEVVLDRLNDVVPVADQDQFATILCGSIDITRRLVVLANAGHPPPLLVTPDGARFASVPPGPPIGAPRVRGAQPVVTVEIPAGGMLIAFTDGLVERRRETLDAGLERLRQAAGSGGAGIDGMLGHLLAHLVPNGSNDDLAMLGVKWHDDGTGPIAGPASA